MNRVIKLSSSDDEVQPRPIGSSCHVIKFLSSDDDEMSLHINRVRGFLLVAIRE